MSAVLFRQCLGNAAGQSATFSKTEMQDSPFLSAKLGNSLLQKTCRAKRMLGRSPHRQKGMAAFDSQRVYFHPLYIRAAHRRLLRSYRAYEREHPKETRNPSHADRSAGIWRPEYSVYRQFLAFRHPFRGQSPSGCPQDRLQTSYRCEYISLLCPTASARITSLSSSIRHIRR